MCAKFRKNQKQSVIAVHIVATWKSLITYRQTDRQTDRQKSISSTANNYKTYIHCGTKIYPTCRAG